MEDILVIVLQFLGELLLESLLNSGLWPFPSKQPASKVSSEAALLWLLLGGILGWVCTVVVPIAFIKLPWLRIANLFLSPMLSGAIAYGIAKLNLSRNQNISPRKHFWYAFWFSFGFACTRFTTAQHT